MDPIAIAGASGMRARLESLEMLANNLANGTTAGYKTDREFYSLYLAPEAEGAAGGSIGPDLLPVIERPWTDFSQGALVPTGNPLDFALSGKGFFTVAGPAGALYTRNGGFRISKTGVLETHEGWPIAWRQGATPRLAPEQPITVAIDGTLSQQGQVLGQLDVVDLTEPSALVRQGAGYYAAPAVAAGATRPSSAEVQQGRLESSNVSAPEAAVRLVNVLRQFEMLQKVVLLGGEMNRQAVEEVARV